VRLVGDQPIHLDALGIGAEVVGVPTVVKGVEDEFDRVIAAAGPEAGESELGVTLQLAPNDSVRPGVERPNADVEVLAVVEHANPGGLAGGRALLGLLLPEAAGDVPVLPGGLVERPVQTDGGALCDETSLQRLWALPNLLRRHRIGSDGVKQKQGCGRPT